MDNEASFDYTYSAPEQDEVRRIRDKYLPPEEHQNKLERLRSLDASVTKKGSVWSLILGILSTLVMGAGMSMCMVWPDTLLIPGIAVGIAGMAGVALAYPVYAAITRKERERLAPEILRLTEELLQS